MAVVSNTLIGRARGRVGNAVFRTHKGQNILSQKPEVVANPRSGQQQANRARFTALLAMAKLLRPILCLGFKEYSGTMSWMNRFMSTNATSGLFNWNAVSNDWEANYNNLVVAEGSLYPAPIALDSIAGNTISIAFETVLNANQSSDDKLYLLAMKGNDTVLSLGLLERQDGGADIEFVSLAAGDKAYISAFFITADKRIVSNSFTLEVTVP